MTPGLWPQSMFAVGWMELKDPWRAQDLLERSLANIREPFKVNSHADSTSLRVGEGGVTAGSGPFWEQGQQPHGARVMGVQALTTLPWLGVDREYRWVWRCELHDGHGGLPAGSTLWILRVQVSAALTESTLKPLTFPLLMKLSPPPRITGAGMTFDPMCLPEISGVRIYGIFYQGNKLDFSFSKDSVTIEVKTRAGSWAPLLEAELWPLHTRLPLPPGRPPPQTHPRVQSM